MASPAPEKQTNQPSMVMLSGIRKSFTDVEVVKGVDLNIGVGEFFSLLGPSGCGKTTLLRMIAGFESANEGIIAINGENMNKVDANERPTNMVFQSYAIFPHLNVAQNVAYGLKKQGLSKEETKKRVDEMLQLVDLDGYQERPSYALSGGQRQRVALARALIMQPKVLLLDEPLSALDKKLREHMQQELRRLQRTLGITFILVTHDQEEALIMSDRIAVMFDGKIAQVGTPREIYERPVSQRVASFIGVMNFLKGDLIGKTEKGISIASDVFGKITLDANQMPSPLEPGAVTIGIRPEMMSVLYRDSDTADNRLNVKVTSVDYYGDMTFYSVAIPKSNDQVSVCMRNTVGRHVYQIDDEITIGWSNASMVILR